MVLVLIQFSQWWINERKTGLGLRFLKICINKLTFRVPYWILYGLYGCIGCGWQIVHQYQVPIASLVQPHTFSGREVLTGDAVGKDDGVVDGVIASILSDANQGTNKLHKFVVNEFVCTMSWFNFPKIKLDHSRNHVFCKLCKAKLD